MSICGWPWVCANIHGEIAVTVVIRGNFVDEMLSLCVFVVPVAEFETKSVRQMDSRDCKNTTWRNEMTNRRS